MSTARHARHDMAWHDTTRHAPDDRAEEVGWMGRDRVAGLALSGAVGPEAAAAAAV
jgi:hypothetical protein